MITYKTRYVHAIHPNPKDIGRDVTLDSKDLASKKALGAALRKANVLIEGGSIREFRREGDKIVAFPRRSSWHAIVLEPR